MAKDMKNVLTVEEQEYNRTYLESVCGFAGAFLIHNPMQRKYAAKAARGGLLDFMQYKKSKRISEKSFRNTNFYLL